ncbi:MAG: pyruvate dehydrogenase (acetyl-transferring) E1 component subunit alpha [Anaerolineales bacterium]|nr:pyruvate dehydrogenase (acetyl-transferring) E1 component subunit alpha [Anaerolineales bacterium]MCS7247322.1 pyruvate dehydrogenase (acetyl-transferring) E1 component subunit alpha [Anaerolineales bacterium]MDW8161133.1 pyruvate dehydrogenase (acetyl-transferring) E1 component subunit alpha [Anaerolineales bacterium]MDW8446454.1 pyruvate dehydrogenase (acetyl-transferring) E1 component subunit alpha [Anaerolineales bacterium]
MDKQLYLDLYYQMVLIRLVEEASAQLYQQGKIGGFLHLYIGQEAVSTGIISARQPKDRVITAYRDHGVAINVGIPAKLVLAELLGKATGVSKGKGGSMHLADVKRNFWGGHAIVGAHLPIAVGLALGDQYQGSDAVTICMFGDGATNIGFFHEALNLSKVWNLPVLWVCENNQYGMGTAVERASAVKEIRQKALGYNMPNSRVNGMDVLEVRQATLEVLDQIRAGGGPHLMEVVTYRYRGHSMGDPERYRQAEEVKRWQENDPIGIYRRHLETRSIATPEELDEVERRAEQEVTEAVRFAEESPEPPPEALFEDIYAE